MSLRPIGARVLVKPAERKSGSIIIPETREYRDWQLIQAEVIAIGDGAWLETGERVPVSVKPGDIVLIPDQQGYRIWQDGEQYILLNERDIVAAIS
jgi:chaperonin GroES